MFEKKFILTIKFSIRFCVTLFALCVIPGTSCSSRDEDKKDKYEATWESLKKAPVPSWFDDGKFGIFIHWGGYSVVGHRKGERGYAETVPKLMYAEPDYYYPYLEEHFGGHPPEFGYKDIIKQFKAENWDPEAWASLFKNAGAKYVVLTAEHHDGFALWDSDLTEWCATKVGPRRDLVGDLCKAVRAEGLKFSPSYHRERHPGFFAVDDFSINSDARQDILEEIRREPSAAELYGPFSYTDEFMADYANRWKELQEKYRPDFMWIDDIPILYHAEGDPQALKFQDSFQELIAGYLNAAQEWGKDVYLNNKGKHLNWPEGPGCLEKDNLRMTQVGPKWQNPATMGTSYGYRKDEEVRDSYKSPLKLIHILCDVVSKNGNLLLNIGPRADGTIPEGMQTRLLEMGKWLSINGEGIYGTRCWDIYGEGPSVIQGESPGKIPYTHESIRYTVSKNKKTLYALQLVPDKDNRCVAKSVTPDNLKGKTIKRVSLLGISNKVSWKSDQEGLTMQVDAAQSPLYSAVWKIEME